MVVPSGLLLTHGAGGDSSHRLLVALEEQLDLPVYRMDFPYRKEGRKAPDRANLKRCLPFALPRPSLAGRDATGIVPKPIKKVNDAR